MSIYKKITEVGSKFITKNTLFKYGFNLSPIYRRSTGRIIHVSKDIQDIKIKIKLNYKNRNYMGSMFGGSLYSAVDPIPMVQLFYVIGNDYVIWDKSAEISYKLPVKENVFASFTYTPQEIESIKKRVANENEITIIKNTTITNSNGTTTFCKVDKTIYIANKQFYKEKIAKRKKEHI